MGRERLQSSARLRATSTTTVHRGFEGSTVVERRLNGPMNDSVERDVLVALAGMDVASAASILPELPQRAGVMRSSGTVESLLFDLERDGMVEQEAGIAEYHLPGTPSPIAERLWEITDRGRSAVDQE